MGNKDKKRENEHTSSHYPNKVHKFSKSLVNSLYLEENFCEALSTAFCDQRKIIFDNGASFSCEPFRCCVLPQFLNDEHLIHLKEELMQLNISEKDNDLFQFKQSLDLGCVLSPQIEAFKKIIYEDFLPWMIKITGLPLTNSIDMTFSLYNKTDVLLCHDDELEGRRIAFIYYLVPEWKKEDGGTLDLFNSEIGNPTDIAASFLPVWNNFIFFEVSQISFHQVSEILSDKSRTSISGWYHGPPINYERSPLAESQLLHSSLLYEGNIREWINPIYFQPDVQFQIRQTFKDSSEIEIPDFLQPNKYFELSKLLSDNNVTWKMLGPPNSRHYEELQSVPDLVKECCQVLQSEAMCLILSNLTGLQLHELAESDSSDSDTEIDAQSQNENFNQESGTRSIHGRVCCTIRRWSHGFYTLLRDNSHKYSALDAILYFNCEDWISNYGGYTCYCATEDELLRVEPKCNSFALVYSDEETDHFVKYINSQCKERNQQFFHDISLSYTEE